jgi:hypothetical protein
MTEIKSSGTEYLNDSSNAEKGAACARRDYEGGRGYLAGMWAGTKFAKAYLAEYESADEESRNFRKA